MYEVLLVIHTILVLFLIGFVLIQRTDSDGLSGLGGGGGNQFMTGRGSANLMTRATAILAGIFMLTSLLLAVMASNMHGGSIVDVIEDNAPATMEEVETTAGQDVPKPEETTEPAQQEPVVPKPE